MPTPTDIYRHLTLREGAIGGPLQSALVKTLLGAGIGYGSGKLTTDPEDPEAKNKVLKRALLGGGVGFGLSVPDIITSYNLGQAGGYTHQGINSGMAALVNPVKNPRLVPPYGTQTKAASNFSDFEMPSKLITPFDSISTILSDPTLDPLSKAQGVVIVNEAANGNKKGLFTTGDLVRGAVMAGFGYLGGVTVGKALGTLFGLPNKAQKRLAQAGAVGAVLKSTGVWG